MNSMMTTTLEKKVFIFSNNRLFSMPLFEETYFFSLFKNKDFPIKQKRAFLSSFFVAHPGNLHYAYTRNAVLPDIIILLTKWIFCSQLSSHCFCFLYILFTFDYHCNNLCDLIHIIFLHSTCCNRWCSKSYTTCYKR